MPEALRLIIHTDGGSRGNPGPTALGVVILIEGGQTLHKISQYLGTGTNNEAEYDAILASLSWLEAVVADKNITHITWKLDSKLVVEQLNRHWKIKEDRLRVRANRAWQIIDALAIPYSIVHILRHQNKDADTLVNQALDAHWGS